MPASRVLRLAALGTAAGLFSALFGVGGGTILVPGLLMVLAYGEREATGTSLAAIGAIAAVGAVAQGLAGHVDVGRAALVGLPAVPGVLLGVWLQQRVSTRLISLLFALVLVIVSVDLLTK